MSETLIVALADKVIALLKRREEQRRDEFADVITPIRAELLKVHENYVSSFRAYGDLIRAGAPEFSESHPVFATIAADTLYSAHLRTSLKVSTREFADAHQHYCEAIRRYVERAGRRHTDLLNQPEERESWPPRNLPRHALSQSLLAVATMQGVEPSARCKLALSAIDAAMDELQRDYAYAELMYGELRSELLEKS